jgi:hypothetical protein
MTSTVRTAATERVAATGAPLLRLLPVAAAMEEDHADLDRTWGPIGALSGLAERFGGAVSETIGIDVDAEMEAGGGNGGPPGAAAERPTSREPSSTDPTSRRDAP